MSHCCAIAARVPGWFACNAPGTCLHVWLCSVLPDRLLCGRCGRCGAYHLCAIPHKRHSSETATPQCGTTPCGSVFVRTHGRSLNVHRLTRRLKRWVRRCSGQHRPTSPHPQTPSPRFTRRCRKLATPGGHVPFLASAALTRVSLCAPVRTLLFRACPTNRREARLS